MALPIGWDKVTNSYGTTFRCLIRDGRSILVVESVGIDTRPDLMKEAIAAIGIKEKESRPLRPAAPVRPIIRDGRTGRNARCGCGSGRKFKRCCGRGKT